MNTGLLTACLLALLVQQNYAAITGTMSYECQAGGNAIITYTAGANDEAKGIYIKSNDNDNNCFVQKPLGLGDGETLRLSVSYLTANLATCNLTESNGDVKIELIVAVNTMMYTAADKSADVTCNLNKPTLTKTVTSLGVNTSTTLDKLAPKGPTETGRSVDVLLLNKNDEEMGSECVMDNDLKYILVKMQPDADHQGARPRKCSIAPDASWFDVGSTNTPEVILDDYCLNGNLENVGLINATNGTSDIGGFRPTTFTDSNRYTGFFFIKSSFGIKCVKWRGYSTMAIRCEFDFCATAAELPKCKGALDNGKWDDTCRYAAKYPMVSRRRKRSISNATYPKSVTITFNVVESETDRPSATTPEKGQPPVESNTVFITVIVVLAVLLVCTLIGAFTIATRYRRQTPPPAYGVDNKAF